MKILTNSISGCESGEVTTPAGALTEFYRAFNSRDLALMRLNWHPEECVLNNPLGGIRRGWSEIESFYTRLFCGPARVEVVFFDYTLHESAEMFVAAGRERGHFERGDIHIELAIRTSRIFRKVAGRWRQIHHHGSIEDAALLTNYKAAVFGA